jgi:hypothetical protein
MIQVEQTRATRCHRLPQNRAENPRKSILAKNTMDSTGLVNVLDPIELCDTLEDAAVR